MREKTNTVHNFLTAAAFLKGKTERKIAHDVQVVRLSQVSIAVRLHNTNVITFNSDNTATLTTEGWDTALTARVLNAYSGGAWRAFLLKRKMMLTVGNSTARLSGSTRVPCND